MNENTLSPIEIAIRFVRACGPVCKDEIAIELLRQCNFTPDQITASRQAERAVEHCLAVGVFANYDAESYYVLESATTLSN